MRKGKEKNETKNLNIEVSHQREMVIDCLSPYSSFIIFFLPVIKLKLPIVMLRDTSLLHQEMKTVMTFALMMGPSNGFISSGCMQLKRKRLMVLIDSSVKYESHVKLGSVIIST